MALSGSIRSSRDAYVYDAANRMATASPTSGGTARYYYAPDNKRIYEMDVNGNETWTLYGARGEKVGVYQLQGGPGAEYQEPGQYWFVPQEVDVRFAGKLISNSGAGGAINVRLGRLGTDLGRLRMHMGMRRRGISALMSRIRRVGFIIRISGGIRRVMAGLILRTNIRLPPVRKIRAVGIGMRMFRVIRSTSGIHTAESLVLLIRRMASIARVRSNVSLFPRLALVDLTLVPEMAPRRVVTLAIRVSFWRYSRI